MTVRMRLGAADVARVRLVCGTHPVGSAVIGSQVLRAPSAAVTLPALRARHDRAARAAAVALELVPRTGLVPDFLTPTQGLSSLAEGIEAIRSTSPGVIREQLRTAYAGLPATPLRRRLLDGDREVLDGLATALGAYFAAVFEPVWSRLVTVHQAEVGRQSRVLAADGVDGLFGGLHPAIRWRSPVLEVETWWSGEVELGGHGLRLVPSVLAGPRPRLLVQPAGPALLVYPVAGRVVDERAGPTADGLRGLLGRTRAAVLRRLAAPGRHTTTGLARAAAISPASASEHASALRAAGLVETVREGRSVVHRLTAIGMELVERNGSAGAPRP